MDCALTILADGEAAYPSLLGSGGNDGKNDFARSAARLGVAQGISAFERFGYRVIMLLPPPP